MRKLKRNRNKKQIHLVIGGALSLLLVMTVGYAAFSTNVTLNAKGNIIKPTTPVLAADYIKDLKEDGDATLIDDETDDHNIRYTGKDVKNYVCVKAESDESCLEENLYRIIGVFNDVKKSETSTAESRIKIIKATKYTEAAWDSTMTINWARPATLNETLNDEENGPIVASSDLVDDAVWYLGAIKDSKVTVKGAYDFERGTTTNRNYGAPTTWTGKVALMYPSDYGYASSACYNDVNLGYDSENGYSQAKCTESNWLFVNQSNETHSSEWTISDDSSYFVFHVSSNGDVYATDPDRPYYVARPAAYLKSTANITADENHDGSFNKPYLLTE